MKKSHIQNIALGLAEARKKKMASGGMVKEGDYDLDEEHERNLSEIMIQGDQPPVANPEVMDEEMVLAKKLHAESEKNEYYAMGGLVEPMSGDEKPEVSHAQENAEPPMKDISEAARMAIENKKKMRRFIK